MSLFGAPRIAGFVLTRDSWILLWGKIVGAAGFVVSGAVNLQPFLSEKQAHALMAFCAAVVAISAQLGTSPLPSQADADKVTLPVKES